MSAGSSRQEWGECSEAHGIVQVIERLHRLAWVPFGHEHVGAPDVRALLCGMRGSTPAPGADFSVVGGNTSCVAIRAAGDRWLILDAGTGLARLASVLDGRPLRASILLSHLHWDHTHGLPFLLNADRADAELDVLLPAQADGSSAIDVMARAMSPPHFPLTPDGLQGTWRYRSLDAGPIDIEGFAVTAADVVHRGGRTFGYRVDHETGSLAYLPDHGVGIATPEHRAAAEAARAGGRRAAARRRVPRGGTEHRRRVRPRHRGRRHRVGDDRRGRAARAHPPRLPRRTDAEIAAIEQQLPARRFPIEIGREGAWVETPA